MCNIKEIVRLKLVCGLSHERIGRALGLSKGVVSKYVVRAQIAGLDWAAVAAFDDTQFAARLCPVPVPVPAVARGERAAIDLPRVHRELRRKGVGSVDEEPSVAAARKAHHRARDARTWATRWPLPASAKADPCSSK